VTPNVYREAPKGMSGDRSRILAGSWIASSATETLLVSGISSTDVHGPGSLSSILDQLGQWVIYPFDEISLLLVQR
jgi:hypothetical protein